MGDTINYQFIKNTIKYKSPWHCLWDNGKDGCAYRSKCWNKELAEIKKHKFYIKGEFYD